MDSLYAHPLLYASLHDQRTHDLPRYEALARVAAGEVLEIGAGTGRVSLHLARAGHRVVAVEREPAMFSRLLERLRDEPRAVAANVTPLLGDISTRPFDERFALVICPFNGLAHQLTGAELSCFSRAVQGHLAVDGVFAFDTQRPNPQLWRGASGYVPWFRNPEHDVPCRVTERLRYHEDTQTLAITLELSCPTGEHPSETMQLRLKQHDPETLRLQLTELGWQVQQPEFVGEDVFWHCHRGSTVEPAWSG